MSPDASSVCSLPLTTVADDRALAFHRYTRPELLRIGLVLLDTDYTLERDWHRLVGDDMELFCTRMPTHAEVTPAALKALEAGITPAAATLVPGLPLHTLVFGCTSGGLLIGDVAIAERLHAVRPEVAITHPWLAIRAALDALEARRIAVLTPYVRAVDDAFLAAFIAEGIEVAAIGGFRLDHDPDIPAVDPACLGDALASLLEGVGPVEAVVLPCTNLRALDVLDELEQRFGVPCISSNQALYWHARWIAGRPTSQAGFGRLLAGV
ncbi:maleate cis-trans isomerase family protein [Onishia taeanensis]